MRSALFGCLLSLVFIGPVWAADPAHTWEESIAVKMLGPGNVDQVRNLERFDNKYPATWPTFLRLPEFTYLTADSITTRVSEVVPTMSIDKVFGASFISMEGLIQSLDDQLIMAQGFDRSTDTSSLGPIYIYESADYRIAVHCMTVYSNQVLSVYGLSVSYNTPIQQ